MLYVCLSVDNVHVGLVADVAAAHRLQVRRFKLTVYQGASVLLEVLCQSYKGQFRGAGCQREHAFAKEATSDGYAIKSSRQFSVLPHFHTGGKALPVQFGIGLGHFLSQPGTGFLFSQVAAKPDDVAEGPVERHFVASLVDEGAHGVGDVYFVWEDDKAVERAPPLNHSFSKGIPGENTVRVGQ